ncbi:DUF3575 domain-containing protein [Chryseobacterium lacus]|uniref:DUF3575 domain-containing protein n=1 Tax=Chryseobacterium lacus TaxID=2058346 RepID=UPI002680E4D5|nr:DUF3575 domain-containing protein [Chryseobacterium lacus]
MMKTITLTVFLLLCTTAAAQENVEVPESKKLYLKANAVFLPVGIINAGAEYQLSEKMTIQGDVFISPWKSVLGKYAQMYMLGFDARYYFEGAFNKWYVGANISGAKFIMQKWNYWSDGPYQLTENSPIYVTSDLYQDGFAFALGATVGYQFPISERWNMDIFAGGGFFNSYYKGFHKTLDVRYDEITGWNKSSEWIPYRGGVMFSYKLK